MTADGRPDRRTGGRTRPTSHRRRRPLLAFLAAALLLVGACAAGIAWDPFRAAAGQDPATAPGATGPAARTAGALPFDLPR